MKGHVLPDPRIVFLNHGSYRACPKPVLEQALERGIATLVNGAQAPGQIATDLAALEAALSSG